MNEKIICILLSTAVLLCLFGCSSKSGEAAPAGQSQSSGSESDENQPSQEAEPEVKEEETVFELQRGTWDESRKNFINEVTGLKVTITVSDETREVEKNITVIQQNLEVIKPYVSAEEQEVLMRFEGEVREFEVYSNMSSIDVDFEDTEKSKWCSANIKDTEDGFVLEVIASANYSETSRDCWIVLKVSDGDQESTERIHVIQDPFRRNIQYDGISVCVRWGGTLHLTSRSQPALSRQ